MTPKTILYFMILILGGLFIWALNYRKKEKMYSKFEADYASPLLLYKKDPTNDHKKLAIEAARNYGNSLRLNPDEIDKMIKKDIGD